MSRATRRVARYTALVVGVIAVYTVAYRWVMLNMEGVAISFIQALHVVIETFTTTGYGEQAELWTHPVTLLLTSLMQLTGVTLIFMTLPLFVVPLIEEALSRSAPRGSDLSDHVLVCGLTDTTEALLEELDAMEEPGLVVLDDAEQARELDERGLTVVHGNPESVETLEAANIDAASAVIVAVDDEAAPSVALAANEAAPEVPVVTLSEDDDLAHYQDLAGADEIVSPRRLLGERLASKATSSISMELGDAIEIGEDLDVAELLVQEGADIEGDPIGDCGVSELPGTNVIGAWFRGEFVAPPPPEAVITDNTILLVAGPTEQLERIKQRTVARPRSSDAGSVVVVGHGVVGRTVTDVLAREDVDCTVVDLEEDHDVDVVGDATERRILEAAGVQDARSVVFALGDDTTAVFATLVTRDLGSDVEIIVRANAADNVPKLYRAGADYVLALTTVAGRMLASKLLDREVVSPEAQVEIVRMPAPALVGRTLTELDLRANTGCTVLAVERNGELLTRVDADFQVQEDDTLVVAGSDDNVAELEERVS